MYRFSAENPLALLKETQSSDWLSDKSGLQNERWGHATDKSVFDPCPQGWRVPDVTFVSHVSTKNYPTYTGNVTNSRGTSPWYFADGIIRELNEGLIQPSATESIKVEIRNSFRGVPQNNPFSITTDYLGSKVVRNATDVFGWKFNNSLYYLGNYPMTGIINYQTQSTVPLLNEPNISGLWTAAPGSFQEGFANAIVFSNNSMLTNTDRRHKMGPQTALNIRCVQHQDIYRGGNGIAEGKEIGTLSTIDNTNQGITNNFEVYPNPVEDILYISKPGNYQYKIFDASGKLVGNGSFTRNKIDVSYLLKGIYIINISNDKEESISQKIIKK